MVEPPVNTSASARVVGQITIGEGDFLAQGTVVRSSQGNVRIAGQSSVLENSVVIGTPLNPVVIGQKVVFGHRCIVIGATIGDLCEVGNGSIIMPGAQVGIHCILGEGTLIEENAYIGDRSVVVGRPGRVVRQLNAQDEKNILELRGGDLSISKNVWFELSSTGVKMGKLYSYKNKSPQVASSAVLFDSAEITGDVQIGEDCIIGAGVKIIGDSHGPVRIGARVQILENTVLHLLPHNELVIEDDVVIGPGCMIHGCHIGRGTVVEPGANICDFSRLGQNCLVKAGALIKQRSQFLDAVVIEGFPAREAGKLNGAPTPPDWIFNRSELPQLIV